MKIIFILFFAAALFFAGCAPQQDIFYWGDYSGTLYELTKDPNEVNLEAHKKQLLQIFEYCEKRNKRIPPGVSGEYGYILLKEGQEAEGMTYLEKEISLYPESAVFINRIKAEYERKKNENS